MIARTSQHVEFQETYEIKLIKDSGDESSPEFAVIISFSTMEKLVNEITSYLKCEESIAGVVVCNTIITNPKRLAKEAVVKVISKKGLYYFNLFEVEG